MKIKQSSVKPFYTTRDVAQLLNVSEDTVREFNKFQFQGFPRGFKVVNKWRWKRNDIDNWVDEQIQAQKVNNLKPCRLEDFAQEMFKALKDLIFSNDRTAAYSKLAKLVARIEANCN